MATCGRAPLTWRPPPMTVVRGGHSEPVRSMLGPPRSVTGAGVIEYRGGFWAQTANVVSSSSRTEPFHMTALNVCMLCGQALSSWASGETLDDSEPPPSTTVPAGHVAIANDRVCAGLSAVFDTIL